MNAIALDTNALVAWLTSASDDDFLARFRALARPQSIRLIIPTVVVAEYLVKADSAQELDVLRGRSRVVLANFDLRAAYECAENEKLIRARGSKRG